MAENMHRALLLALSLHLCLMKMCEGFCFSGSLVTELTEYQRLRHFCVYKTEGVSLKLLPGSKLYTADCLDCSCDEKGLHCCGFGYKAGVAVVQGCVEKRDGCSRVFVRAENQSLDCETGKPVNLGPPQSPHPDNMYSIKAEERRNMARQPFPKPAPPAVTSVNTLPNTNLFPGAPIKDQMNAILNEMFANAQRRQRPYFQHVTSARQVPVATSQQSMFQNEASPQDSGWLPWLFFLN